MGQLKAPPIGLIPKWLYDYNCMIKRHINICKAIERYQEAKLDIPKEWLAELSIVEDDINKFNLEHKWEV